VAAEPLGRARGGDVVGPSGAAQARDNNVWGSAQAALFLGRQPMENGYGSLLLFCEKGMGLFVEELFFYFQTYFDYGSLNRAIVGDSLMGQKQPRA
jgi:hypothetical protein